MLTEPVLSSVFRIILKEVFLLNCIDVCVNNVRCRRCSLYQFVLYLLWPDGIKSSFLFFGPKHAWGNHFKHNWQHVKSKICQNSLTCSLTTFMLSWTFLHKGVSSDLQVLSYKLSWSPWICHWFPTIRGLMKIGSDLY